MSDHPSRTVIVLAAGEGKRMRSATPKVLHQLLGRSLLGHVLAAAEPLAATRTLAVVGAGADQVAAHLADVAPYATPVVQAEQRGTGHAVRTALESLTAAGGTVVVLFGDTPLLSASTLVSMVTGHESAGAAATLLTAELDDPTGLGRIVRDGAGRFVRIVEERDADDGQRAIREINAGAGVFDAALLGDALGKLGTGNDQGEEYLTDVPALLLAAGHEVRLHPVGEASEALGCNDRAELAKLRALLRDRVNTAWMRAGVTILDPATTWIDVTATVERDAVLDQDTQLRGVTTVGEGAHVGPDVSLVDTVVQAGASVVRAHAIGSHIGLGAQVGPYASLRAGSRLAPGAKVGTFVETKNSEIGEGAKVPHQSYVGDATIGAHANIGAGTIVVNYDGQAKHHTDVGEAAFVGCNANLVAPVTIGDGAYVAAGTTVTKDVAAGALAVERGTQQEIDGWVVRRRPGTKSAAAASAAAAQQDPA